MKCSAITRAGERCKLDATTGSYCWSHAPENAHARKQRASKGGKSRGAGELAELKRSIRDVIEAVRDGSLERSVGAVLFQGYNTLLKAAETERRWYETQELEARIEELEEAYQKRRHTAAWG